MEEEEDTIIIEVNNEDWEEANGSKYHVADFASVGYEEEEDAERGEDDEYTEGAVSSYVEEVGTQVLQDGRELDARVVTYENIPVKEEIHISMAQDYRTHESYMQNSDAQLSSNMPGSEVYHGTEYQNQADEKHKQFDFVCPYCPMKYTNKSLLKAHLWIHPQHKPYTCQVCNSSFRNKLEVDEHAKRHFYNKNFFCRVCGESLSCRASCIKHMKRVHEVSDENIDLFILKEVPSDGKMMLVIRTVRNGKVYKRKFALMEEQ